MGMIDNVKDGSKHDPFAGYDDAPIECEWLVEPTGEDLVRLVVDDERWDGHWPNVGYQRSTIAAIRKFVGATLPDALIICPGGMITIGIEPEVESLADCLREIDWGDGPAVLVGVDGAIPGVSTPVQTVMRVDAGASAPDPTAIVMKLYPTSSEVPTLRGWHRVRLEPDCLRYDGARRWIRGQTTIATLICHEAIAFAGRSISNRTGLRVTVAEHLERSVSRTDCIAISMHHADMETGRVFMNAIENLSTHAPVVTSVFAPGEALAAVAERFAPRGDTRVATLLVRDAS